MKLILLSIIIIIFSFFSGCSTIIDGNYHTLYINSSPDSAKAEYFSSKEYKYCYTPCTLFVEKTYSDSRIVISKEGYIGRIEPIYNSVNFWVFGNLIFGPLGWFIGIPIDLVTGSAIDCKPNYIYVGLEERK